MKRLMGHNTGTCPLNLLTSYKRCTLLLVECFYRYQSGTLDARAERKSAHCAGKLVAGVSLRKF